MLHGAHSAALGVALTAANIVNAARADADARAYARAVATRDLATNEILAAEVLRLRKRLAAAERQRDDLARALAAATA